MTAITSHTLSLSMSPVIGLNHPQHHGVARPLFRSSSVSAKEPFHLESDRNSTKAHSSSLLDYPTFVRTRTALFIKSITLEHTPDLNR
jgi:hypothetical protein